MAYVLDASALLAFLQGEPGAELVEGVLELSVVSSVNWSEVAQKAGERGVPVVPTRRQLEALGLSFAPFGPADAERASELWSAGRRAGLSLGDRACLALASVLDTPALTTDRAWTELPLREAPFEVEVELLR
ncbi:MAG: type II toxin-antitoxin system VapC family toxin [Thermoanaerobaculia bacterium]